MADSSAFSQFQSQIARPISSSSKNTILKGPKYTQWDIEKPKSTEPYQNRLFEVPFTVAANELTHLGGLGVRRGRIRSKVHPARPTIAQNILNQRTGNRINFSLTNEIIQARKSIPPRKIPVNEKSKRAKIIAIVNKVCYADNLKSPQSPRTLSPSSDGSRKIIPLPKIYGRPKTASKSVSVNDEAIFVKPKTILDNLTPNEIRSRASSYNEETDVLDFVEKLKSGQIAQVQENKANSKIGAKRQLTATFKKHKALELITLQTRGAKKASIKGTIFGPFTTTEKQSFPAQLNKKFLLPETMVSRIVKDYNERSDRQKQVRRARLYHMNRPLPPSSDYSSSNENEQEYDNVKCLSFIKTPYFTIPTVKIERKPRKNRLKNRFLNVNQMKRIRYLFLDDNRNSNKECALDSNKKENEIHDDIEEKLTAKETTSTVCEVNPKTTVQKFKNFVRDCYLRKINDDFEKGQRGDRVGFKAYKSHQLQSQASKDNKEAEDTNLAVSKISLFPENNSGLLKTMKRKNFRICKPAPLFHRKNVQKSYREVDERGPVAMDPNFMPKLRHPELLQIRENDPNADIFLSATRYSVGVRNRLQVNSTSFNNETFGSNKKYLHRLATEWDEDFVNELHHNKKFKKFNVKTDILRMREYVRKNFNIYYMKENLVNLKQKQEKERQFIEDLERFSKMCMDYIGKLKDESYDSLISKIHSLKPLEARTKELLDRKKAINAEMEHATETLLGIEQHWEIIMRLQNYYYVLMDTEWRRKYDWIHRKTNGSLEEAIYSVQKCRTANIRPKENPSGFEIIRYFNENIFPNIDKMKSVKPNSELLKNGLQTLQSEVFTYLNQYNKTLYIYEKIVQLFNAAYEKNNTQLEAKKKLVYFKQVQQRFVEERNYVLKYETEKLTKKPLRKVVQNFQILKISAICDELYLNVIPAAQRSKEIDMRMDTIEKLSKLHGYLVLELLYELDKLPTLVLKFTERKTRENRRKYLRDAQKALIKQTRFELLQNQLRGFFNLKKIIRKQNKE